MQQIRNIQEHKKNTDFIFLDLKMKPTHSHWSGSGSQFTSRSTDRLVPGGRGQYLVSFLRKEDIQFIVREWPVPLIKLLLPAPGLDLLWSH